MRSRAAITALTRSPTRTLVEGFAELPLTRTCPPSHSWVARDRVLTSRTAHSHRSIRVSAVAPVSVTRRLWPLADDAADHHDVLALDDGGRPGLGDKDPVDARHERDWLEI